MKNSSRGFTLIEILAALAIGAMMFIGLSSMVDSTIDDSKGQQAAMYQKQLVAAVGKYLNNFENYQMLLAKTAAGPVALELAVFSGQYLPTNFPNLNIYQHRSCVLVKQRAGSPEKLDVLIVGNGGIKIMDKQIAAVAAMAGQGNGYLLGGSARGVAWELTADELAAFNAVKCAGQSGAEDGHLASALFFDGPDQLSNDFVYRNQVPGRPELNSMNAELRMKNAMIRLDMEQRRDVGTSDELCSATNSESLGRIALDSSGALVSCQDGKWARSGSWKDPVADFTVLPAENNQPGDVRMVQDLGLAFRWNGIAWKALAVDQDGNLLVKNRLNSNDAYFSREVVAKSDCVKNEEPDGTMAHDSSGLIMSCQYGKWQSQTNLTLQASETDCAVIKKTDYPVLKPDCDKLYDGKYNWYGHVGVWEVNIEKMVMPTKDGLINVNVWYKMNRTLAEPFNDKVSGQIRLQVDIYDNDYDPKVKVGRTDAQSVRIVNSSVTINATLSKAVKRNKNGYTVVISPNWTTGEDDKAVYDRANYYFGGNLVEQVPLSVGWNIDLLQ